MKSTASFPKPSKIRMERWKYSRFWAVFIDDKLLTLTVYKKGALALCDHLEKTSQQSHGNKT